LVVRYSMKKAVRAFCTECIYDPNNGGMRNVSECPSTSCPLWGFRPLSKLSPEKAYDFEGFSIFEGNIVRGKWVEYEMTDKERESLKRRREHGAEAIKAAIAAKNANAEKIGDELADVDDDEADYDF